MQASIPLSPGMMGWDGHKGQPEIFNMLDGSKIGVELYPNGMMTPRKSLTMVTGIYLITYSDPILGIPGLLDIFYL